MKRESVVVKPHTITIRLDSTLSQRLRKASYELNEKKQPLIRSALTQFFLEFEAADPQKRTEILDLLLGTPRPKPPLVPERVSLDQELSGMLQWLSEALNAKYQTIAFVALQEYIKAMKAHSPDSSLYVDLIHTRNALAHGIEEKPK